MTVFQRLARIAKPFRRNLYGGVLLAAGSTVLETAVIPGLVAAMLALVQPGDAAARAGQAALPGGGQALSDIWTRFETVAGAWCTRALGVANPAIGVLVALAMCTVVVVFIRCILSARSQYLMHRFANLLAKDLRERLFTQMLWQPPAYFDAEKTGAQLTRITSDVVVVQTSTGPNLVQVLQGPLTILLSLVIMAWISWPLLLAVVCLAPLIAVLISIGGRKVRRLVINMQERLSDLNGLLIERLANIRIIQSFVREEFEGQKVTRFNQEYYRETMHSVRITTTLSPGVEFIAWFGMILGMIVGGLQVLQGTMDVRNFFLFMLVAQRAGSQFKMLSMINTLRQQVNGAGERIFQTLDLVPAIRNAPDAVVLPPVAGHVSFEEVGFRYATGDAVLTDISFTVAPGDVIALVGPSGSGKTSLVNLLPRFYDPTTGWIRLDGQDLRTVTLASLRAQVGIVPQETALFSGSIYENILYGDLHASMDEVVAAARAANALEFIERLPDGIQTIVGERGALLSGGQRQRVAIARALLKNPRVLVLDEATSALDTESEQLVQQALERLMLHRTTFVIAHRLSTVQDASRILVLDRGRIVESGDHAALLAHGGLYARLHDMQFRHGPEAIPVQ